MAFSLPPPLTVVKGEADQTSWVKSRARVGTVSKSLSLSLRCYCVLYLKAEFLYPWATSTDGHQRAATFRTVRTGVTRLTSSSRSSWGDLHAFSTRALSWIGTSAPFCPCVESGYSLGTAGPCCSFGTRGSLVSKHHY